MRDLLSYFLLHIIPLASASGRCQLALLILHQLDHDPGSPSHRTPGHGADVILDCVGGTMWERNVRCLAVDGRWVLYGTLGGKAVQGDLLGHLLKKKGRLITSLLRSRSLQVS